MALSLSPFRSRPPRSLASASLSFASAKVIQTFLSLQIFLQIIFLSLWLYFIKPIKYRGLTVENYFQSFCLRWIVIGQLAEAEPNKLHLLVCNKSHERHKKEKLDFWAMLRLNSQGLKTANTFPILKTSAKSVQTTRVVCTDYSWSLQKVLRTYNFKYA